MERTGRRGGQSPEELVLALVQEHAVELLRFARRFSLCADDAHDAYQRGIEILLRRMRTDPPDNPLSWVRTVIRNECTSVRTQRETLVGRKEIDLDGQEARDVEDPADRAVGFERVRHTAEALQRLKPQELTALVLRAEGLTYKEICARTGWTYTKTNRAITEGRRALLRRLGEIESGAECTRWLPLLSVLADGEATARQIAELRPHLRACPGCRATLRHFHGAPGDVAALVPVVLVPLTGGAGGVLARHLEAAIHTLLERTTLAAMRVQGAVEALPGAKIAAVAASTAALAGGGVAIERATQARPSPTPQAARAVVTQPARGLVTAPASLRSGPWGSGAAQRGVSQAGPGEFALDAGPPTATRAEPPPPRASAQAAAASQFAAPEPPTPTRSTSSQRSPPAEFAGP
jgi:RNA polymerase sigma factor (sigma-70 family)